MATNNLTDEDIQAIASSVYELILQGSANSINYGKAEDEMEIPTTEEERMKYNLGVIYVSGETKKAGNMHIQKLFTVFGSDAQTVLNNYVDNTLKGQLDDHTEAKKTQLTQKETSLETALTEHVDDTLKPDLDTYVTTTSKEEINDHVEEKIQEVTQTAADEKTQLQQYSNQAIKPSLDNYTATKKSELDTKSVQLTDNFNNLVITKRNEFTELATEKKTEISNIYNLAITLKGEIVELGDQYSINFSQVYSDTSQAKQAAILAKEAAQAAADQALAAVQRLPAGIILPFAGPEEKQPPYTLFCDGSEVEKELYPDLYAVVGDIFGTASVSTKFRLPDLITTIDGTGDGNYIRYGDWSKLGQKIQDAIRNISARVRVFAWNLADPRGAFSSSVESSNQISGTGANNSVYINFDANVDSNNFGNKMSGHANGNDIHPYSIYLVPLISY